MSDPGPTILACHRLARVGVGIEKDPSYVDLAVRRWQNLTGLDATLDGDGRTFAEIARERGRAAE